MKFFKIYVMLDDCIYQKMFFIFKYDWVNLRYQYNMLIKIFKFWCYVVIFIDLGCNYLLICDEFFVCIVGVGGFEFVIQGCVDRGGYCFFDYYF